MRKTEIVLLSLVLGGTLLLTGCSFQFQSKSKTVGEVSEVEGIAEEELATTHTVVKGETLWDIAGYEEVYGNPMKWKLIYEANKDIMDSPDALKPGQTLIIPRE